MTKSDDPVSPETRGDLESSSGLPRLDTRTLVAVQAEEDAHVGVKTVEAAERVYGRFSKWFLFIGYVPTIGEIRRDSSLTASVTAWV